MNKPIKLVMLVDDSSLDNMIHARVIKKSGLVEDIIVFEYAEDALAHLKSADHGVDVILLDVNMPRMDGYEFLAEYERLADVQQAKTIIIMLSTSTRDEEADRAKQCPYVIDYHSKPLDVATVETIAEKFFSS